MTKGIINAKVNTFLCSGKTYTKEEASSLFDIIFKERLDSLSTKIKNSIKANNIFDLIFSSYTSFASGSLPNKASIMGSTIDKQIDGWQVCGFYKSNELVHVNYDLPSVWPKFKTIDASKFALFYYRCCLNLVAAIEHIAKFKGKLLQKLTNELAHNFKVGPRNGNSFQSTNIDLKDLVMIDLPPAFTQRYQEEEKTNTLQSLINSFADFLQPKKDDASQQSQRLYAQDEFAAVVVQFIQFRSTINADWELIFNKVKYTKRVAELADDFLKNKNNFDHELVQSFVPQIDSVFDDYNSDLKVLGLSLSQEAMSLAHKIAFVKMFELFSEKRKKEAYVVEDLWVAKRPELLEFFVSQLAPDQSKDVENAKQFVRKLVETIDKTLSEQQKTLITTRLKEREDDFSRLKLQASRDASLTSMSKEDLLRFVLSPTEFIFRDFTSIWNDFRSSLRQEFNIIKFEQIKLLDELANLFRQLNEIMASMQTKRETFKAQELFRTSKLLPESEKDINKNVYLKVRHETFNTKL